MMIFESNMFGAWASLGIALSKSYARSIVFEDAG
jgi:hypothetical protein